MIALLVGLILLALAALMSRDATWTGDSPYSKEQMQAAYGVSWRDRDDEQLAQALADELQCARVARLLPQQPAVERLPARRPPDVGRRVQA